jgi:hypothetical protein
LRIGAEPIEAQFHCFGGALGEAQLADHFGRCARSDNCADTPQSGTEWADGLGHIPQLLENKGSSITFFVPIRPYQKCKADAAILLTGRARLVTFARDKSSHGPKGVFSKE